jgi:hypothetical protein
VQEFSDHCTEVVDLGRLECSGKGRFPQVAKLHGAQTKMKTYDERSQRGRCDIDSCKSWRRAVGFATIAAAEEKKATHDPNDYPFPLPAHISSSSRRQVGGKVALPVPHAYTTADA